MGISGTLLAQNISKIMMGGKTYRYLAILFPLFILSIPHLTYAAVCNMVDGVVYGYGYDTGGEIKDYGVLGSGCGTIGSGDNFCDAPGTGGGGCTAIDIGAGLGREITVGIQNEGSVPDRYRISWITPAGWKIVPLENESLTSSINVPEDLSGNPPAVGYCVDKLNPQVTYPCYNPGEAPFFTFKVTPPSDFAGSQELVFDVMSLEDNSRVDSVKAVISSPDVIPPAPVVLRTGGITERSVRVEWIAPDVTTAFFDDFTDGTFSPWSLLQNGVIEVVDSGEVIDGQSNYVLRKTVNGDPNGGWAPLSQTVGDFELILYTKRLSITCCNAARYSITDASGNGYGLYLDFNNGNLYMERRDAWVSTLVGTESALSGGLILNQWYTLRFTRTGQTLTAQAYVGRVGPATATPAATVSASDSAWVSFSQVNVNGGYDYDTDDVQVNAFGNLAASYDLRYSTSPITTEAEFANAAKVDTCESGESNLERPKAPGSSESCTVSQLFADTDYYFAIKTFDEVANYSISICPLDSLPCHAQTLISSGDISMPGKITDLSVTESTEDTISLCWTAPAEDVVVAFFDDFTDGTFSPWSLLQNGVIEVVDSGEVIDGQSNYVLRKTTNGDPNGGWAPLSQTVGDFELILYTKRLSITCCNADRYSITDASGNGYGLYLDFNNGNLYLERRDAWVSTLVGTESALSGGLILNQWYTLRLTKVGQSLTAQAYVGRVGPATATPAATVSASDSVWVSFSQVNVNGGYDYDNDDVQVKTLGGPATEYILKYSTKYIVDDGVTPGVGEVTFSDAIQVAPSPTPESPGVRECHIVPVKNIIDTSGILPPGACNLDPSQVGCDDRTRNTRFYFAIKALDEVRNKSPLSNVAGGLTPP